jgi:uncharacterized protein DUF2835
MATTLRFSLHISREEVLRYYQGSASSVIVSAENGQRLQFPAEHIRPFIEQDGVQGTFSISYDNDNKLIGIKRLC